MNKTVLIDFQSNCYDAIAGINTVQLRRISPITKHYFTESCRSSCVNSLQSLPSLNPFGIGSSTISGRYCEPITSNRMVLRFKLETYSMIVLEIRFLIPAITSTFSSMNFDVSNLTFILKLFDNYLKTALLREMRIFSFFSCQKQFCHATYKF